MIRVAAIDCGTNTIKLLIADLEPETGEQLELVREMRIVRLGQDVDRTGLFAENALARTFAAVDGPPASSTGTTSTRCGSARRRRPGRGRRGRVPGRRARAARCRRRGGHR